MLLYLFSIFVFIFFPLPLFLSVYRQGTCYILCLFPIILMNSRHMLCLMRSESLTKVIIRFCNLETVRRFTVLC